ncbi:DUF3019 domain-containing protein [Rheinheimera maricola]|uniref:DUF3019 domain-containing protein n=1 Tax=Rheinheimera maricola TaxID=2793282 RepID=A0ABS7XD75_9GAMM|nr:DUF3019 domain-containing protein [Rheinheimera maricola]MBZ9613507.1 DUF3019 domain-containing protein [Rheinheimera maricola]
MNGITAAQGAPAPCEAALCWNISPQICLVEQPDQDCSAILTVHWVSTTPQSLCLYVAQNQLQCWQDATIGQWQQQLNWQNSTLSLRQFNDTLLLQTELKVLSRKPMRRRIASPWSIF